MNTAGFMSLIICINNSKMPQREGSCTKPLRRPYVNTNTASYTHNSPYFSRQRCIMIAMLSRVCLLESMWGCRGVCVCVCVCWGTWVLPGISFTVVLPGYDVLKQLSACHPAGTQWQHEFVVISSFSLQTDGERLLVSYLYLFGTHSTCS